MHLDWLEISGFRSYESLRFEPDAGTNVLIGPNGAGKTNVLEAIGYLSSLKSFRGSPDASIVGIGATEAVIRGSFRDHQDLESTVEISIPATGRRTILLNGKRPRRNADVAAAIPMVTFLPDDLDLVKGGPGRRREYLDDLVAALTPVAGGDATEYERALRQRNALLRTESGYVDRGSLDALDEQVARLGGIVLRNRLGLVAALGDGLASSYRRISASEASLRWVYRASWYEPWGGEIDPAASVSTLSSQIAESLVIRRDRDLHQKTTTTGPHRDDPYLVLDDRDLRTQASQGEQRSSALALRVIAYRSLEDRHNTAPILLLDDVFSELDPGRSDGVVELLPGGQVFVTSARDDEVPLTGVRWDVGGGHVIPHKRASAMEIQADNEIAATPVDDATGGGNGHG